jgi:hypothetical protein
MSPTAQLGVFEFCELPFEAVFDMFGIGGDQGPLGTQYLMGPGRGFLGRANPREFGHKAIT